MTTSTPYNKSEPKKQQVARMFDSIAPKYDFLNHLLSANIDKLWRSKCIRILKPLQPKTILDVATGTGDFAIAALKLNPNKVIGIDISENMLEHGRVKLKKKNYDDKIELLSGDSEQLAFDSNKFDAVTVGFGVRNFENLELGLKEMLRVLKPDGKAVILEFSKPSTFPIKQLYSFYFKNILPTIGKMVSKDNAAYTYLPDSVQNFPQGNEFLDIMKNLGYKKVNAQTLTFGIASIYTGIK
ncbi:MAG: bifunctional demethylmenaquinone methyltransferase/2-methoxy-6-polyprenyl-1,4-benzoquinol methylase UbiE [Bacteroidia bacterium]|nr:bifunctional demethylmenaquinone methyltransferase/2-methoxy-6-polyprenyl-1,4-benzoquinol methylase UbiE [Bacteroidia bacterium]NNC84716.1 bifunctional demethylmenaquinone methyltransferase/2-methoxy-6-polyprenyl-1,4-benzoquinol methylase UbiE [Bacteroidia bacterium]NNM16487.1 bifunctional demethylmenaquinone methyltransferase/2-methoxy-6-polyprenyl-1,4-benzoquinol methylase UbiE [Bacteroidia bacterium]